MDTAYLYKSFFIGLFGDIILQGIVYFRGNIAGLKKYFQIHGPFEAVLIAAGIMFISAYSFMLSGLKFSYTNLFIFGGILDLLWRYLRLMKSLDSYYAALDPVTSFIWGGIPMIITKLFR